MMIHELAVDPVVLREEVKSKYRDVAINPSGEYHFHTGKPLARRLGYDSKLVDSIPDAAVESFAGVANPFSLRSLEPGENVVDAGSGGDFDCFVAAHQVGPQGRVVGVDMLPEMLVKSRETAEFMGVNNVEFREGLLEEIPVEDGWADADTALPVVIGSKLRFNDENSLTDRCSRAEVIAFGCSFPYLHPYCVFFGI